MKRLLALALLAAPLMAYDIPAQEDWTDHGMILEQGAEGDWDRYLNGTVAGSVVVRDGLTYLYYGGACCYDAALDSNTDRAVGVATSTSGLAFSRYSSNPILEHMPTPHPEEGATSAAAVVDPSDGAVVVYYGANTMETATTVNTDGRLAVSPDGLTFADQGIVLHHEDPGLWGSGDEIFPVAALVNNGTWIVYYLQNGAAEKRTLGVAWGPGRAELTESAQVLDAAGEPVQAWGMAGVVELGPDRWALIVNYSPLHHTEVREFTPSNPALVGAPVIYDWPDVRQATLALDGDRWLLYYRNAAQTSYGVMIAPASEPPVTTGRIDPNQVQLIGAMQVAGRIGAGDAEKWSYGVDGLTLVPDCMGRPDPSPGDGYPGCIGGWGNRGAYKGTALYGLMDRVPPGEQAVNVLDQFYDLGLYDMACQYMESVKEPCPEKIVQHRNYAVFYDRGPSDCRLWWVYYDWYQPDAWDEPFLGYSSCQMGDPQPAGMWEFTDPDDPSDDDTQGGQNTSKYLWSIQRIPQEIADAHFGGATMALSGSKKGGGSRGGSEGPSLAVRPWVDPPATTPEAPVPITDAKPIVYYPWQGGNQWYYGHYLDGIKWRPCNHNYGGAFVSDGNGNHAWVAAATVAVVRPDAYPANDPDAGCEFGEGFCYWANDLTPDPASDPLRWYGHAQCKEGHAPQLEPQYGDETRPPEKVTMPTDCRLGQEPGACASAKGNQCPWKQALLFFYDLADLGRSYRGEIEPWEVQPYAMKWLERDGNWCNWYASLLYDPDGRILYLAQRGQRQYLKMFAVGDAPAPPDPCGDGVCADDEDHDSCPEDCEPPDPCGDGYCDEAGGETHETCPADCPDPCGDGLCDPLIGENHEACPTDCPDTECDVAGGDNCLVDPEHCGACPECPPSAPVLTIVQDGTQATVVCATEE